MCVAKFTKKRFRCTITQFLLLIPIYKRCDIGRENNFDIFIWQRSATRQIKSNRSESVAVAVNFSVVCFSLRLFWRLWPTRFGIVVIWNAFDSTNTSPNMLSTPIGITFKTFESRIRLRIHFFFSTSQEFCLIAAFRFQYEKCNKALTTQSDTWILTTTKEMVFSIDFNSNTEKKVVVCFWIGCF